MCNCIFCLFKDRVKASLDKIQEDESTGHRKIRTHKARQDPVKVVDAKSEKELPKKPKPKVGKVLPPEAALSFDQILKLAAAKQHEPIKLDKKVDTGEKKGPEVERPMTKKEKDDLIRRKEEERNRQLRKEGKLPPITAATPSTNQAAAKSKEKILPSVTSKDTGKSTLPSQAKAPTAKLVGQQEFVKKPIERPDLQRNIPAKSNPVRGPSPSASKTTAATRPGSSATRNPPPKTQSHPSHLERPPVKGKSLAPPNSRAFPPYKDIRPIERAYKSKENIYFFNLSILLIFFFFL